MTATLIFDISLRYILKRKKMKRILSKVAFSSVRFAIFFATILVSNFATAQVTSENVGSKLTSGRIESLLILIVGIASVVIGWRAMKRSTVGLAASNWKKRAVVSLILGLTGIIFSGIHLTKTSGGFGTGGGKAGAIVAIIVASTGIVLAVRTLYRIRNNSKTN
jgi:Family of unknown function (DUF6223)